MSIKLNSYQYRAAELFVTERIPMLRAEARKGSTAVVGKFTEGLRIVLNAKPTDIIRCRAANRTDIRIGRNVHIEVKTGSGAVTYGEDFDRPLTPEDRIAENILPNARLVIWYPFNTAVTAADVLSINTVEDLLIVFERILKHSWIFTRNQFIETLAAIGKNGLKSSLKVSKNGGQLNIQTITPRMEDRLYDILETMPTADTLLK